MHDEEKLFNAATLNHQSSTANKGSGCPMAGDNFYYDLSVDTKLRSLG